MIDQVQNPRVSGYMKDPDMQAATDEISAILRKYDLMGIVLIAGRERTGWNIEISPSWSCVRPGEANEEHVSFRIRSKAADYPDKAEQERVLAMTMGGIMGMMSNTRFVNESLANMLTGVSKAGVEMIDVQRDPSTVKATILHNDEETPREPPAS